MKKGLKLDNFEHDARNSKCSKHFARIHLNLELEFTGFIQINFNLKLTKITETKILAI